MRTPIATFTGSTGTSAVFALVESVDMGGATLTAVFPRASTGGASAADPPSWRVTLRITGASVVQKVATTFVPLADAVGPAATTLTFKAAAPAVAAKAPAILLSTDECGLEVRQSVTITQAAAAGAREWTMAAPLGRALSANTSAVIAELKPLALADLNPGDLLVGPGSGATFGLVFNGSAPNFVLTRLVRECKDDPCPRFVQ